MGSFATNQELADFLQIDVGKLRAGTAALMLRMATAAIQGATGQKIEQVIDDEIVLEGNWTAELELPQRPVTAITAIQVEGEAALAIGDFKFTREGKITRLDGGDWGGDGAHVTVTYTHGYEQIPDVIRGVCWAAAARAYANPTGAVREDIGEGYVVRHAEGQGAAVWITEAEAEQLSDFGAESTGTIRVRS